MFDGLKHFLNNDPPEESAAPTPDAATLARMRAMIEKGMKHEGYQLYQSATHGSLHDAMTYVNALEAEMLVTRPDIRWGADWLPATCPQCGGALAADTVKWLDEMAESARCPACHAVLRDETAESDDSDTPAAAAPPAPAAPAAPAPQFVTVNQTAVGGYAPEQCAYCQGRGRHFTDMCPACGGQGSALVPQPAKPCARCGGDGSDFASQCSQCHGTGWEEAILLTQVPALPPGIRFVREACAYCSGSGHYFTQSCPACQGKGGVGVAYPSHKCANCDGRGKYFTDICPACSGSGWAHHARL